MTRRSIFTSGRTGVLDNFLGGTGVPSVNAGMTAETAVPPVSRIPRSRFASNRKKIATAAGVGLALAMTAGPALPIGPAGDHASAWIGPARARADISMGVVGDSYSESWVYHSSRRASRTWSDLIGSHGRQTNLTLGPIGNKSTPAGRGYAGNWAYGGATTGDVLNHQLDGLAHQVSDGSVRVGVVAIGLNDFGSAEDYDQYTTQTALQHALNEKIDTVISDINTIVSRLQASSPAGTTVPLVIGNIPDATATPDYQDHTFTNGLSDTAATIRAAIKKANQKIEAIAHDHHGSIPVVNLFGLSDLGVGDSPFTLDGDNDVSLIKAQDPDSLSNGSPHEVFWADNFHPTTIVQGLFANSFITALQEEYGWMSGEINLLPSSEILAAAGYSGSFDFNYSNYVTTAPTPTAAGGSAVLLALAGLLLTTRRRRKGGAE